MNPACRLNLESPECQMWLTAASSHCGSLLPNAEEASLWDRWWPDELPAPYKTWISTMSAFDCHRLRKEVANQLDESLQASSPSAFWSFCRWTIVILVLFAVLIAMLFALKMVIESCRGKQAVECSMPPPFPPPQTPKLISVDVEAPPPFCQQFMNPKSFISFGQRSDPLTPYGPYRHLKMLKTNSVPDRNPMDAQAAPSPHPRKPPRKKKSVKK